MSAMFWIPQSQDLDMALTFSLAYKNNPEDFEKRVYAQLQAQSIAIAAALALAAMNHTGFRGGINS
ncbi:hypothetical protein [Pantoea sp. 18069]|uniref:hypothetical protein n=1 Tax=Pantoea sp. 18069 TaxID=2681415 RepID=UPI001357A484|nr:hypothetical protein [Pantoea sp. 18069]